MLIEALKFARMVAEAWAVSIFKRRPRHAHEWVYVGYGGAGWHLYRCGCGAVEIDA